MTSLSIGIWIIIFFVTFAESLPPYVNISTTILQDATFNYKFFGIYKKENDANFNPFYKLMSNYQSYFFSFPNGTFTISDERKTMGKFKLEVRDDSRQRTWFVNNSNTWEEVNFIDMKPLEDPHPHTYMVTSSGGISRLYPQYLGHYKRTNKSSCHFPVYKGRFQDKGANIFIIFILVRIYLEVSSYILWILH